MEGVTRLRNEDVSVRVRLWLPIYAVLHTELERDQDITTAVSIRAICV